MQKRTVIYILISGLFISCTMFPSKNADTAEVHTWIQNKIDKAQVSGFSYALVNADGIVSSDVFGYAHLPDNKPLAQDSIFQIASVSKLVTGTAVMILVEEGRISLETDIRTLLPFSIDNPSFPTSPITVSHMLRHLSGIKDNFDVMDAYYTFRCGDGGDSNYELTQYCADYLSKEGVLYNAEKNFTGKAPGTDYEYSNTAYGVLGVLVETVSGQSFTDFTSSRIFEPLGMKDTSWLFSQTDMSRFAYPHSEDGTVYPAYSFPTYPDGSLKTTKEDFSRFLSSMMKGGKGVFSSPNTLTKMIEKPALEGKMGLTWTPEPLKEFGINTESTTIGHTGGDDGIITAVLWNTKTHTGLIVFMNSGVKIDFRLFHLLDVIKYLVEESGT
ncbi:MAG: beta-lactamase family protein [Spirochaetaceae bacterium]|nr:beta-lactamase family protein [Spirochaetaceae bacterium]